MEYRQTKKFNKKKRRAFFKNDKNRQVKTNNTKKYNQFEIAFKSEDHF